MTKSAKNGETPASIVITDILVTDPGSGEKLLINGTGTLLFSDLPILTILTGIPQKGGPVPATPYMVSFMEGGYQMHLPNLVFPPAPPSPPYILTWPEPLTGGISVIEVSAFDDTRAEYVILDQSGDDEPTATFYQPDGSGGNYFMFVKADSKTVLNGGPAPLNNNSIHYTQTGFELTLAEVLYQGQTASGEYIFQQIDGEKDSQEN